MDAVTLLAGIFLRELTRLDELSQKQALDSKQLKQLEILVKSYSNFRNQTVPPDDEGLDDLPAGELLARLTDQGDKQNDD